MGRMDAPHKVSDEELIKMKYERDIAELNEARKLMGEDESNFEAALGGKKKFDWNGINRLVGSDIAAAGFYGPHSTQAHGGFSHSPHRIIDALKNPKLLHNWKVLAGLSHYLYETSGHYKRLINHFSDMSTFAYSLDVAIKNESDIDVVAFKRKYEELAFLLEKMSLPHEINKMLQVVFKEGVYYGYAYSDTRDFFFNKLDASHCRSRYLQDGVFNVEINLAAVTEKNFESFPQEVQEAWRSYLENKIEFAKRAVPQNTKILSPIGMYPKSTTYMGGENWYELDPSKAICIRMDETVSHIVPYFIFLFKDILRIDDFKELQKKKAEIQNYRILALKIGMKTDDTEADSFVVSDDTVLQNVETASAVTDESIGILPTALEPEAIQFNQSNNDIDNVDSAVQQLNASAGINSNLFNGGNSTSLVISVQNDASLVYRLLNQVSRWINRKIKLNRHNNKDYKFIFEFLPQTIHNKDRVVDALLRAANNSEPVKMKLGAALGLSPARQLGADFLENVVLRIGDRWRPLQTSHTMPGGQNGESGRPRVADEDLTEAGVQTRDGGYNEPEARDYRWTDL